MTFGVGGGPDKYKNMLKKDSRQFNTRNEQNADEPLSLDINNNVDELDDFEEQERRVSKLEREDDDIAQKYIKGPDEEDHQRLQLDDADGEQQLGAMFGVEMDQDDEEAEGEQEDENQLQPLLFVDINLGGDEQERIVVFEGDTAEDLARSFCVEHNLDDETMGKLEELLKQQMAGVLPKIDEDEYNSEDDTDKQN